MQFYTRDYFEMMKGKRGNHQCKKYGWFGHMAYQCRRKEIKEQKKKKLVGGGNKFVLLLNKVCRRIEVVHPMRERCSKG